MMLSNRILCEKNDENGWHVIERNNGECLCLIGLSSNGYTGENWIGYRINSKDEMNSVPSKYKEYLAFPVRPVMRGCIFNRCAIVRYNKTNNGTDIVFV